MAKKQWSSTAPPGEFHPYIPAEESIAEFTLRAVVLGSLFGLLFGAVTVYVGLRAGLTVSASIPIAVLSISILRAFGRSTILENNIVQTTGSAGESLAAGVMFTIPALIFLGFGTEFTFWRIFPLALLGGWLGVLFMIPLRRQLIVKEHGNLTFPEGTACADVLVAGERGGSFAGRVFWGLGLGGAYTFFMNTIQAWNTQPEARPHWFPGASFRANITSEYLGVGYIIGPKVSGILFAGGVISWLLVMPAIQFFGQLAGNTPIYPSTIPIPMMTPDDMWRQYIRPMGAGAVAAAGLITLLRTLPTIISALRAGLKDVRAQGAMETEGKNRLDRDVSIRTVLVGSFVIVVMMWVMLTFDPIKGASTTWYQNLLAGTFRGGFWIFVCDGGFAHQRAVGEFVESGERDEHCYVDGDLRDLSSGRVDGAELRGACAGDWRRSVHRCGDCGSYFSGSEDWVPGGVDAISTADGFADRRDHFDDRDWGDAEFDEHGLAEVCADADSGERGSVSHGRKSGTEFDHVSGEKLRADQRAGVGADCRWGISLRSGD